MLTTSASPNLHSSTHTCPESHYSRRSHYDPSIRSPIATSAFTRPRLSNQPPSRPSSHSRSPTSSRRESSDIRPGGLDSPSAYWKAPPRPRMVDAGTQYSPPVDPESAVSEKTPVSSVAGLRLVDRDGITHNTRNPNGRSRVTRPVSRSVSPSPMTETHSPVMVESPVARGKRSAIDDPKIQDGNRAATANAHSNEIESTASKRLRPETPAVRLMPIRYETCNPHDLAIVISSMLMELIRYNDAISLRDGHLTRFHSRAPPGISVSDYLQRLTTHATLSPPILLSMVYYIDKLCALYPSFTISSLTVHRFLITSATVASKGLSDSFWTNKTYARVGGVSLKELALLELEFLTRVEWRIVPKPEVLVDYYRSLIDRSEGYELDVDGRMEDSASTDMSTLI